jgi:NAD(P)H-binding
MSPIKPASTLRSMGCRVLRPLPDPEVGMIIGAGATGQLGSQIVERLLGRVSAGQVAVRVRDPEKAKSLAGRAVRVRHGDFAAPATLTYAFEGASLMLVVSVDTLGEQAVAQSTPPSTPPTPPERAGSSTPATRRQTRSRASRRHATTPPSRPTSRSPAVHLAAQRLLQHHEPTLPRQGRGADRRAGGAGRRVGVLGPRPPTSLRPPPRSSPTKAASTARPHRSPCRRTVRR